MPHKSTLAAATIAAALATTAPSAQAGPDEYLGEIITVAFTFCPRGTLEADGRLLPISSNSALFSLLGTTYGGDGRTTFALPDLRGRTVIGAGEGPGLDPRRLGERSGANSSFMSAKANGHTSARDNAAPVTTGQPYIVLKQCVVTTGIFPSRS